MSTLLTDLNQGWNTIGYPLPYAQNVETTFANVPQIIIIKDTNGNVYWRDKNYNGIGDFTPGQGYRVKVSANVDFTWPMLGDNTNLTAESLDTALSNTTTDLVDGWNLVAYNRYVEGLSFDTTWSNSAEGGNLIIAKNNAKSAYITEWNFNGIGNLIPWQGYLIKLTSAIAGFKWVTT